MAKGMNRKDREDGKRIESQRRKEGKGYSEK